MGTVYKLTNKITKQAYVGQTTGSLEARLQQHKVRKRNTYISNAVHKYGIENFEVETLSTHETQEELDQAEIAAIDKHKTLYPHGYNLTLGGKGGKKSEEAKRKMSEAKLGKPGSRKGKKYGPNPKLSAARTGRKFGRQSQETIEKRVSKLRGKKRTEEQRKRMSEAALRRRQNKSLEMKESA